MKENNKNNEENFNIIGLPDLTPIDIPEPTRKRNNNHMSAAISMRPPTEEELREALGDADISEEELHNLIYGVQETFNKLFSKLGEADIDPKKFVNFDDFKKDIEQMFQEIIEEEDIDGEEPDTPETFNTKLLENVFGSIECIRDELILDKFIKKYGNDGSKYLSTFEGVKRLILTELTKTLPFEEIVNLKLLYATDSYIMFFAEPDNSNEELEDGFGFFIAAIEQPDGEFAMLIPEYGNTFGIDPEDNENRTFLYSKEAGEEFFTDSNGNFSGIVKALINFSVKFLLSPVKSFLLSPSQFGTIKNQKVPITDDDTKLRIGTIVSNETPEAILFKKDADLSLDENEFPFFIRFKNLEPKNKLIIIQDGLFTTNLNDCAIIKNSELKYTSNGSLYIDVDLSDIE